MLKWWWLWRTVSPFPRSHSTRRLSSSSRGGKRTWDHESIHSTLPRLHSPHRFCFHPHAGNWLGSSPRVLSVGCSFPIVVCSFARTSRKLLILMQRSVLSSSRAGQGFPLWFCACSELGEQPRGHEFLLCMRLAVDFTHVLGCCYSSHDFWMWL